MQTTTHYALQKPDPNDAYNKATDNANMDEIDAQMYANAQAAAAATAAGASTDTVIGNRTADPTQVPNGLTGTLTQFLSWIANRIKAITGMTNWYDAPPTTLTGANAHMTNTSNPHNVTATQVGAIPTSAEGAANGVATLDGSGHLTSTELPTDVAKTDVSQTWTAPQTFNANVKITGDSDLAQYSMSATSVDANGHYTVTTYTRPGANKYMVSTLSGTMDANGNYPTMTNVFYQADGVTVDHTDTWTLTYDASGVKTGQTVVRS